MAETTEDVPLTVVQYDVIIRAPSDSKDADIEGEDGTLGIIKSNLANYAAFLVHRYLPEGWSAEIADN